jgi:hypothetical protein
MLRGGLLFVGVIAVCRIKRLCLTCDETGNLLQMAGSIPSHASGKQAVAEESADQEERWKRPHFMLALTPTQGRYCEMRY